MQSIGEIQKFRATSLWQKVAGKALYALFELFFWIFLWRWNRGVIHGELPDGPLVLAPNHGSYLDWLLLDVIFRRELGRHMTFLAKQKVVRNPLFRMLAREREAIVFTGSSKTRAVGLAVRTLSCDNAEANPAVCIFPEGTRSRTGEKHSVFCGAATLARKTHAKIVPVALCGFWEVWPPHKRLPTFRRVGLSVHFLEAVHPDEASDDMVLVEEAVGRAYEVVRRERHLREVSRR
jgi:long-chain acyl-CoA synthetase